jgi:hypothetical protein
MCSVRFSHYASVLYVQYSPNGLYNAGTLMFFMRFLPYAEYMYIMYMGCRLQKFKSIYRFWNLWRSKANVIIGNDVVFALCDNDYEPFSAVTRSLTD